MKKISTFFFILLFLFNSFGYLFVLDFVQIRQNKNLEFLLDSDQYNDRDLVELKVALHLPYQKDRSQYERINGEIVVDGILYKYVKRKVVNDTIYVMCIPDTKKMHLQNFKNDLLQIAGCTQADAAPVPGKESLVLKKMQSPYDDFLLTVALDDPIFKNISKKSTSPTGSLFSRFHSVPAQPPDCFLA